MELENKTVIVTGASGGIGEAAAMLFAAEGANVVLGARRAPELERVAGNIRQTGGIAACLAGDVTDETYAFALVDTARSHFGGLDGAFNNAGMTDALCQVPEMDTGNWNDVIATNLTSAFLAAKAQVAALQERGGGSIVFTSSFVGFSNGGLPGMAAYAASKAGMIGLTRSLAADHASEAIRINAILPGGTRTAMAGDEPDTLSFIAGLHPVGRLADPAEIAQLALFLLSDRSTFMTGTPTLVDGGISARLG